MKNETVVRLFDTYANDLYRFALSYVGTKQEAEDIIQNLFLKLLSKNIPIKSEYEKAYLYKMTANMCKDYLKSYKSKAMLNYDELENLVSAPNDIDDTSVDFYNCLMSVNEKYRVPIYLHYYEGYSYSETAKILKLGESAVAMRINRGKEEMKKKWRELYGTEYEGSF